VQEFVAKYKARYNEEPDSIAALAYDAANLLASAMTAAPTLKGSEIRDALAATKDFPGVCGAINFDENRNPVKPATILKVEGGAIAFVKEIGGPPPAAPAEAAPAEATAAAPAEAAPAASAPAAGN
jgi:branched-chain amino acid transport system substrate-binding protein